MGKYTRGKTRTLVAKFNYFQEKLKVKNAAFEKFRGTDNRVSDQFPRAIQEKLRQLVPEHKKSRDESKDAIVEYDKGWYTETPCDWSKGRNPN